MHNCLTCFKPFEARQAHYRCVNKQCVERDDRLSEFLLGIDQVLGSVIIPEDQDTRRGDRRKAPQQTCGKCQTPTSVRLCPHCHGELPTYLEDVPARVVYVLGAKGAGKSLYLIATFEHLEKEVFPTRLKSHFEFCTRHAKEKYKRLCDTVFRSGILLPATRADRSDPELLLPFLFHARVRSFVPYFYPLRRWRSMNIAAFDTSGEDCEKLESLQWCCQGLPQSAGLIILIDPTSFPAIGAQLGVEARTSMVEQVGSAKAVIDNVTQFYRSALGLGAGTKVPIPTAFVLTKIDALKGLLDPASSIFGEARHQQGFDREYCEGVSRDVISFLRDERIGARNIVTSVEASFSDYLFFAATSLGRPPRVEDGHKRADNISPRNPENPWIWLLHRFGVLPEA